MRSSNPRAALYRFFYAPSAPENRRLSIASKFIIIILLFAVTRLITAWAFSYRGVDWMESQLDSAGYVATANYMEEHGHLPTEALPKYRQFPGLSFLMAAINPLVGNMTYSGIIVVCTSGLLVLLLTQYLFDDFRLTILSAVVLPYTVVNTIAIFSEAPTTLCFLIGIWALRDLQKRPILYFACIFIMGYMLIIRQPSFVYMYPTLFLLAWLLPGGSIRRAIVGCAIASLPVLIYLAFNWFTIHEFFPQYKLHQQTLIYESQIQHNPNRYVPRMFDVPFRSLWVGLTDADQPIPKRISILVAVATTFLAIGFLFHRMRHEPEQVNRVLAFAFAVGAICHTLFYVSLGGDFGFRALDRHFTEMNPFIDWALFYRQPLRWAWIVVVIGVVLLFSMNTGPGLRSLMP